MAKLFSRAWRGFRIKAATMPRALFWMLTVLVVLILGAAICDVIQNRRLHELMKESEHGGHRRDLRWSAESSVTPLGTGRSVHGRSFAHRPLVR